MYKLTPQQQREVRNYINLRLRYPEQFKDADNLAVYELNFKTEREILEGMGRVDLLDKLAQRYIPDSIISRFAGTGCVPASVAMRKVIVFYHDDVPKQEVDLTGYTVEYISVPLFMYVKTYVQLYGRHDILLEVPAKDLFDHIVNEGIAMGAADITISSNGNACNAYYSVRKRIVHSNLIMTKQNLIDMIAIMCFQSPMDYSSRKPKYVGIALNDDYRGRVVVNQKIDGFAVTIRLLPNEFFNKTFDDINIKPKTQRFLQDYFLSPKFGLRLIVGATMSGKNTTGLACLSKVASEGTRKIVSIEMPVEQILPGIEQISCESEEEYDEAVVSLLRQNPDYVYVAEMSESTAAPAIRIANTGKIMLSTLHANSCADTIGRLQDVTGLSTDKIIQSVHCVLYQELLRDEKEDKVYPHNTMLALTDERKKELYGKSYGEVLALLTEWEEDDCE